MNASTKIQRFSDILEKISYKPGYAMQVWEEDCGYYMSEFHSLTKKRLMARVVSDFVVDTHSTEMSKIQIETNQEVNPEMSESQFIHFMYNLCVALEAHEVDEWFKVNGVHLNEPH